MSTAALQLRDVKKSYGSLEIIKGVSLEFHVGERHALIGPNGAGKSTLFHLISGRQPLSGGVVQLHGRDVTGQPPHMLARAGLARSFQISNLFPNMTVQENLRCACLWADGSKYRFWRSVEASLGANERARQLMAEIGLEGKKDAAAASLAYAEQRTLEIGLAVAAHPKVLLLDEPTAGMSQSETDRAIELIRRVSVNLTLVMVEHDMGVVFGLADRITVLVGGKVLFTGPPHEARGNVAVREAYLGNQEGVAC